MKRTTTTEQQAAQHQCIGHKEGDWVIFTCPVCHYLRQINCVTKKVAVRKGSSNAIHIGSHAPVLTAPEVFSLN